MIKVRVTGFRQVRAELKREAKRQRFGMARGLTRTAQDVQKAVRQEELRVFNKPNAYTLNAFRVEPADYRKPGLLQAAVELRKDPQYRQHPLTPQVLGGNRSVKRFERSLQGKGAMPPGWFAVPTQNALDGSLKVKRGLIQQIIAQANTQLVAGYGKQLGYKLTKRQRRSRIQAQSRAGGQYVFVTRRRGKLAPGVYLAEGSGVEKKAGPFRRNTLIPLFRYVPTVTYRVRLDFYGIAGRIASQTLARNIRNSLLYSG